MRIFLTAALALGVAVSTTGCFEELVGPYDGDPQVEFAQVRGAYSQRVADNATTLTYTVNLIGPQRSTPTTINVTTGTGEANFPPDVAGGDAVEGTNFTFPDGPSVTIPANSSFGEFRVQILDAGFAPAVRDEDGNLVTPAEGASLRLELMESNDGTVTGAENLDDFEIIIAGT